VAEPLYLTTVVEDIKGEYLKAFFDGFSQGMKATVQVDIVKANDSHHAWESAFRAFGAAIREALKPDEWKKNTIPGVKGTLD
jgi:imidazoleglycerol-phosphate dehydratase